MNILLAHNPIRCDCRLLHFLQFIREQSIAADKSAINIVLDELKCAGPVEKEGRTITSLKPLDLVCPLDDENSAMAKRCPSTCSRCDMRSFDKAIVLNCRGNFSSLSIPNDINSNKTELFVENANLTEFFGANNRGFNSITKLSLGNNNLKYIHDLPPRVEELDLHNNNLEVMNGTILAKLNNSKALKNLSLSGNPWRCDCTNLAFINFVQESHQLISDYKNMKCSDGQNINTLTASGLCSEENFIIIVASIVLAILSLAIGILAALYYKYQKQIKMWLYSHNMCLWFVTEEELDKDKTYDAFVSYAHQDGDFITEHLVPQLENCVVPYKLCLHERDWSPGLEISSEYT
jgi:protein toll